MTLGERIKQLRRDMNMTQVEFGRFIGVSGATISTSESGKTTPDSQTIEIICMKCNVNRDWLVDGIGEMQVQKPLLPEIIHNLRKYPRALEVLSAMRPEDWQAFEALLERLFEQKNKKETE